MNKNSDIIASRTSNIKHQEEEEEEKEEEEASNFALPVCHNVRTKQPCIEHNVPNIGVDVS